MLQDIRAGARLFRRSPSFAALVVLTMAVGIGGTVAMFSVVDKVLFTDLPYRDPARIAMIWNRHAATGSDKVQISGPDFLDYREQTSSFEELAFLHNATDNTLTDGERAEQVDVGYVSANFFRFLGVEATVGRTFSAEEDATAGNSIGEVGPAVISHGLWARRYGSDPGVLGRTVYLSGRPVQILGVTPPGFRLILPYTPGAAMSSGANDDADVWRVLPERAFPDMPRSMAVIRVLGRLAPGMTLSDARHEFDRLADRLRGSHQVHQERETSIEIVPLHAEVVGHVRAIILALFGGVAVVLLIACANVANLISVQSNKRSQEIAVRFALGARPGRIVRQCLTEHALLAGAGALLGIVFAHVLIRAIVGIAPPNVPMIDRVVIDLRTLGFAIVVATATTLMFGLWPAFRAASTPTATHLSTTARSAIGRGNRFRSGMVTAEIALSLVLLVAGGLLIRSFVELQAANLGFEPAKVFTARIALGPGKYNDEALRRRYWDALKEELDRHPAIESAGFAWPLPFSGQGAEVPYDTSASGSPGWGRNVAFTTSAFLGYFETMKAEVLEGRVFQERDLARAGEIAVVDDGVAERLYPGGLAVGRMLWVEDSRSRVRRPLEIIGVVRHIRHSHAVGAEREVIYRLVPAARNLAVVVQAAGGTDPVIAELRRISGALDPDVPLFDERTLASYVDDHVAPTRFTMTLAATFGAVSLLMATVGLYGVVSYTVSQRTPELGVRIALGAGEGSIVRLVMGRGLVMVGIGLAVGLVVAYGVARAIGGLLVEVPASDPLTFGLTAALLAASALVASYVPARRAASLDPAVTLRAE
ncbi:MAG TPA: ABC transporter permease [Vicinamibacterales bacterium]|nr:ABC transporter permease [Vicinamibacterales bacterium]